MGDGGTRRMTSIHDIARKARTSIGTVDRVLHSRGRVAKATRTRVLAVVRRMGYKPNIYARHLSLDRSFTFGVLIPERSQDGRYWVLPVRGIRRAEDELRPYKVRVRVFHYDRYSVRSFCAAARRCANAQVDGLLLAPVVQEAACEMLSTIFAKVPYVFFDSSVPNTSPLATVWQDPLQSGVLAGNLMRMLLPDGGRIAAVKVTPADNHIESRVHGFLSAFEGKSRYDVDVLEADSKNAALLSRAVPSTILGSRKNYRGAFVSNAWTHPLARYFLRHGGRKHVALIGYDLIPENCICLENKGIDFLISQRPAMQGYRGIMALYRSILLRERVARDFTVPLDIVTRDSYKYYKD